MKKSSTETNTKIQQNLSHDTEVIESPAKARAKHIFDELGESNPVYYDISGIQFIEDRFPCDLRLTKSVARQVYWRTHEKILPEETEVMEELVNLIKENLVKIPDSIADKASVTKPSHLHKRPPNHGTINKWLRSVLRYYNTTKTKEQ